VHQTRNSDKILGRPIYYNSRYARIVLYSRDVTAAPVFVRSFYDPFPISCTCIVFARPFYVKRSTSTIYRIYYVFKNWLRGTSTKFNLTRSRVTHVRSALISTLPTIITYTSSSEVCRCACVRRTILSNRYHFKCI